MAVDELSLVAADPVKGQNPCMLIQVDANPPGLGGAQQLFLTVVPEGEASPGPVQAPGESVVTQTAQVVVAFTFHLLVSQPDGNLCRRKGGSMLVLVARLVTRQQHAPNLHPANLYRLDHLFLYLVASPLHLPVVRAPTQRLSAENLSPEVETFWVVRRVHVLGLQRSFTASV